MAGVMLGGNQFTIYRLKCKIKSPKSEGLFFRLNRAGLGGKYKLENIIFEG